MTHSWKAHGRLVERRLDGSGWIRCDASSVPGPGQFVPGYAVGESVIATALFPSAVRADGFLAAPSLPEAWQPGTQVALGRPSGRGFFPPDSARRIALVGLLDGPARLLPLVESALARSAEVVIVASPAAGEVPPAVEVQPPSELTVVLRWADYAAFDVDRQALEALTRQVTGPRRESDLPSGEVLVVAPMPCGGMAECGACAVRTRRGARYLCRDGPVLDLADVLGQGAGG